MRLPRLLGGAALLSLVSCSSAPQEQVEVDLLVQGTSLEDWRSDVSIDWVKAELAFGPLYLCAGTQAGENCDAARLEWGESTTVDLLANEPEPVGELRGVTGTVRSWMFDYGLTSLLTQREPFVSSAAAGLGGHSLRVSGVASLEGTSIPLLVLVRVFQSEEAEQGVQVLRKSATEAFFNDVTGTTSLTMRFDASGWLGSLNREAIEAAVSEECVIGESSECEEVQFDATSEISRKVAQRMTSGESPSFSFE